MANTEDLRYVRTETAIRAAFMELVAESPIASVTASAICRRAGISRNAFYLHHSGVPALYAALIGELVEDIRAECLDSAAKVVASGSVDANLSTAIFNAFAQHEKLLRALLPPDDGSLAKRLAEGVAETYVEAALPFGPHGNSFEHQLACSFAAWAHVGLVSRWVSTTNQPLADALSCFEALQAGISQAATRFLVEGAAAYRPEPLGTQPPAFDA